MMLILKGKYGYLPKHDVDVPMFKHCVGGHFEVKEIADYIPIFNAHGVQIIIQDTTLSNDGSL